MLELGIWSFLVALAGARRFRWHFHGALKLRLFQFQTEVVSVEFIDPSQIVGGERR